MVLTNAQTQHASAISSIVPFLVSLTMEPHREILTCALLDTQSNLTFVLEDLIAELNVNSSVAACQWSTSSGTQLGSLCQVQQVYT